MGDETRPIRLAAQYPPTQTMRAVRRRRPRGESRLSLVLAVAVVLGMLAAIYVVGGQL